MKEEIKWNASSGRLERIFIFYGGLIIVSFFFRILILIGVFIIPITLKKLLSNKLVKQVSIDDNTQTLKIKHRKSAFEIPFDELAFAFDSDHKSFNELTFYRTYIGTRGQVVKQYVADIIGMKWTTSWEKSQIISIVDQLNKRKISSYKPTHKELTLWERFI